MGSPFFFNVSSAVMFPNLHFLRKSAYPQLPALPCTPLRSHFYASPITTEVSRHVHSGAALPSSVFLPSESHLPCDWFPSLLSPPPSVDLYVGSHLCTWSIVEPASPERARLHSSCWIWRARDTGTAGCLVMVGQGGKQWSVQERLRHFGTRGLWSAICQRSFPDLGLRDKG